MKAFKISKVALFLPAAYMFYTGIAHAYQTPLQMADALNSRLESMNTQVHQCIIKDNPELSRKKLKLEIETVIRRDGSIESVVDYAHIVPSLAFETCIASPIRKLQFEPLEPNMESVKLNSQINLQVTEYKLPMAFSAKQALKKTVAVKDRPRNRDEEFYLMMNDEIPALHQCYKKYLATLPSKSLKKAQGPMLVKMVFNQDGEQVGSRLVKSPFKESSMNDCVMGKLSSLRLSATANSAQQGFEVTYPINFKNYATQKKLH